MHKRLVYRRPTAGVILMAAALAVALIFSACSASKNTAGNRKYQEFITRYNIYYNGDTHYRETLADMESKYEDDYSRMVFMHPVEAKADPSAPQPTGDFNRSIEKAQKAIQLRSIKKKPAKKAGKTKIKVKTKSGKSAVCTVTVKQIAKSVRLNKSAVTVKVGKRIQLKAVMKPAKSSDRLKWSSSDKKIAKVDKKGRVTGIKQGRATITVKTSGGKSAKCKVTVK